MLPVSHENTTKYQRLEEREQYGYILQFIYWLFQSGLHFVF